MVWLVTDAVNVRPVSLETKGYSSIWNRKVRELMSKVAIRATKIFTFDAAHCLPGHKGKCADMHGHTYRLEVTVTRTDNPVVAGDSDDGMVMDFSDLKQLVNQEIIDKIDHKVLNEVFPFRTTSENLARHFYEVLNTRLQAQGVSVYKVVLWESASSYVEVGE